jgi:hypothetical protein
LVLRRDPIAIKRLVLAGSSPGSGELTLRSTHGSSGWRRRRKLRLAELYAMFLTRKPYNQLTEVDKAMAREDLARKVLKYYFSSSWSRGYFELLRELDDFYEVFPKAGRDKVTFVRFIRSLSIPELKVIFSADPAILFSTVVWLKRHEGRAKRGGAFGEFYQKVLQAVSELQSDRWSRKMVKAVFRLLGEFKPAQGADNNEFYITIGRNEAGFYDYLAVFLVKTCHAPAGPAFTAAVIATRHIVAHYFFDPTLGYRARLDNIKKHFKPLFGEYPEAEALIDDYFVRSVVKSLGWQDLVRFVGADIEKLEQYYQKNKHKLGSDLGGKILNALLNYKFINEEELRKWWHEHILVINDMTALACHGF